MTHRRVTASGVGLPAHELAIADMHDRLDRIKRETGLLQHERDVARARVTELERHRCAACQATRTEAARVFAASLVRSAAR